MKANNKKIEAIKNYISHIVCSFFITFCLAAGILCIARQIPETKTITPEKSLTQEVTSVNEENVETIATEEEAIVSEEKEFIFNNGFWLMCLIGTPITYLVMFYDSPKISM